MLNVHIKNNDMKALQKPLVLSFIFFSSFNAFNQARPDIGVRINSAEFNRIQLEFRKPISEKYTMRFGLSQGQSTGNYFSNISDANDSLVTFREKSKVGINFDFRFGFERNLSWKNFSLHGDLIVAYNKLDYHNWDSYTIKDSSNVWSQTPSYDPTHPNSARAVEHYIGGGLAAGISYNFPLSERFILNLNLNYTGLVRFNISHHETADNLNEFFDGNGTTFDLYTSAGVGIRYVFVKKEAKSGKG